MPGGLICPLAACACERMEKCGKCELLPFCRGCMAVAYGATGDFLSGDPQCWKVVEGAE